MGQEYRVYAQYQSSWLVAGSREASYRSDVNHLALALTSDKAQVHSQILGACVNLDFEILAADLDWNEISIVVRRRG